MNPINHMSAPICHCPEWIGTSHYKYKQRASFGEWWEWWDWNCAQNIDSKITYDFLNKYLYLYLYPGYPANFTIQNNPYLTIRQILLSRIIYPKNFTLRTSLVCVLTPKLLLKMWTDHWMVGFCVMFKLISSLPFKVKGLVWVWSGKILLTT